MVHIRQYRSLYDDKTVETSMTYKTEWAGGRDGDGGSSHANIVLVPLGGVQEWKNSRQVYSNSFLAQIVLKKIPQMKTVVE